jgi:hypothetical protein
VVLNVSQRLLAASAFQNRNRCPFRSQEDLDAGPQSPTSPVGSPMGGVNGTEANGHYNRAYYAQLPPIAGAGSIPPPVFQPHAGYGGYHQHSHLPPLQAIHHQSHQHYQHPHHQQSHYGDHPGGQISQPSSPIGHHHHHATSPQGHYMEATSSPGDGWNGLFNGYHRSTTTQLPALGAPSNTDAWGRTMSPEGLHSPMEVSCES